MESTRDTYGKTLLELGKDPRIVVLDADTSVSTKTSAFASHYPKRFVNVGCAEQNLLGTAAGLAASGKIAFASSYAVFVSGRAWEQIRNTIAHDKLNVKIVVTHAGLTNASDGSSHQSLEDIALMRVIPNMTVIVPADAVETRKAVLAAAEHDGPVYVRLNRTKAPLLYTEDYDFSIGRASELTEGDDVAIIATGTMVAESMKAAEALRKEGVEARVINLSTIKPIDRETIIRAAKDTGAIVTVEEHSIYGGLGSAVSEVACEEYPVPVKKMGVDDRFGQSGEYEELLELYGLNAESIIKKVRELLKVG